MLFGKKSTDVKKLKNAGEQVVQQEVEAEVKETPTSESDVPTEVGSKIAVMEDSAAETPAEELLTFIQESPSPFHTVATVRGYLDAAGFTYLPESAAWDVKPGGMYYTQRNGSSIIAWCVGDQVGQAKRGLRPARLNAAADAPYHFKLTASHSDSPTFKLKSTSELDGPDGYLRLDTEAYGGMIDYTWFDRPLSLAGRALVREGSRIESKLVALNRDVAIVPSLAIHFNREVNKAFSPSRASDVLPIVSAGDLSAGSLNTVLADALEVESNQIVSHDLFLVNRQAPCVWGATNEFVSAPKLDDLMCAFTSLKAFLAHAGASLQTRRSARDIAVYACFDNEEVGSETKQGAASTLLYDVLARVNASLDYTDEDLRRALAASILVSCDNAHAAHPAHPELSDPINRPRLNRGLVIKEAANQHYCTDAFSRAALTSILDDAGVAYQSFANRSDMAGGSTLGNISNMQVSVYAVDVGCAQLAMHSSYETAGAHDVELAIEALTAFYNADVRIDGADAIELG